MERLLMVADDRQALGVPEVNPFAHHVVIPSEDLLVQQMELEQGMTELGIARYRARTQKDIERGTEDATAYGVSLITQLTETVAEGVREFLRVAESGRAGRRHAAVKYLRQVDPRVAAYLGLKGILSSLSSGRTLQAVAHAIAGTIEDEVRYAELREEDRNLYTRLKAEAVKRVSAHNKRAFVNHTLNRFEKEWEPWPVVAKQHVGTKMIDIVMSTVGLIEIERFNEGRNKTTLRIKPTDETRKWIEERNAAAGLLQPMYEPMVHPPKDWEGPRGGGYLTRYVRPLRLVKSRNRGYLEELENIAMPEVYEAVNAAQQTAWTINFYILDVLNYIWDNAYTHGKVPPKEDLEIPPKPHDIDENEEARREWRAQAARVHRENRELLSSRTQFAYTLTTANKYSMFPAIYFPYQFDFRGRLYAVPALNPQGPDFMKALLQFSEAKPLTEESAAFLAIHLANCAAFNGLDKEPLGVRAGWAYENAERIIATARSPFDDLWWTEADEPFQFLAACNEWAGWMEHGEGYPSRLAVALDGSCSGIQHFSAMLRDEVGGEAVNLTASETPSDIYIRVLEQSLAQIEADAGQDDDPKKRDLALQWLAFKPDRDCVKRPTMTYGYGSREFGFRDQIMQDTLRPAYRDFQRGTRAFPFDADGFDASLYMAKVVSAAVDRVVVKAAEAMEWLKGAAQLVSSEGLPVHWTTPDGFPVLQAYRDLKRRRVETMINGTRVVMTAAEELPTVCKRSQAQGISPNFVHSLDGTHLRMAVVAAHREGMRDFALVHDSFGVHAADTPRFFQVLRETFVDLYERADVIEDFRTDILRQLDESKRGKLRQTPSKGSLDLSEVLESDFCFA